MNLIKPEHHSKHIGGLWIVALIVVALAAFTLWHFGNAIRLDQ